MMGYTEDVFVASDVAYMYQSDVAPPAPSHRRRAPLQWQHVTIRQERD
jgi:hypothetical protein